LTRICQPVGRQPLPRLPTFPSSPPTLRGRRHHAGGRGHRFRILELRESLPSSS
jgi:hypothetical protein